MSDDRRESWRPPAEAAPREGGIRGALGGSKLFEQPQYAGELQAFRAFVDVPGPLAVEVGFDDGARLLDLARTFPDVRWLGLEVREARVLALASHAPPNLHVWRADARTVFGLLMPAGRVSRIDILFPTPWWDEGKRAKRLLLTPGFRDDMGRALAPDGVVHIATDVGPYFEHVAALFAGWPTAPEPSVGTVRSRRERVCARDGLPVWRGTWGKPPQNSEG
jgi:tRNA (guanine-N7-)-methyltransferase